MIAYIRGKLAASSDEHVWIEAGGIAYEISVHQRFLAGLPAPGTEMIVYTYYQVLENEVRLYGFMSTGEQELFKKIIGVSGFGARGAMGILSAMNPAEFVRAVISSDEKRLTTVPGIGKKTAQRLLFELKDRLGGASESGGGLGPETAGAISASSNAEELLEALETLGYSRSEVVGTVAQVLNEAGEGAGVEQALRLVLKRLAR